MNLVTGLYSKEVKYRTLAILFNTGNNNLQYEKDRIK